MTEAHFSSGLSKWFVLLSETWHVLVDAVTLHGANIPDTQHANWNPRQIISNTLPTTWYWSPDFSSTSFAPRPLRSNRVLWDLGQVCVSTPSYNWADVFHHSKIEIISLCCFHWRSSEASEFPDAEIKEYYVKWACEGASQHWCTYFCGSHNPPPPTDLQWKTPPPFLWCCQGGLAAGRGRGQGLSCQVDDFSGASMPQIPQQWRRGRGSRRTRCSRQPHATSRGPEKTQQNKKPRQLHGLHFTPITVIQQEPGKLRTSPIINIQGFQHKYMYIWQTCS